MIDYGKWRITLDVIQLGAIVGIGIYTWWTNREKITNRRFADLEKLVTERASKKALEKIDKERDDVCKKQKVRINMLEKDVFRMESDLRHVPSHQNLADLGKQIGGLQRELAEFSGRLGGINRAVDLINEFLITQGVKPK